VGRPASGIEFVRRGQGEHALDGGGSVAGAFGTSELPVLVTDGEGPSHVLDGVLADFNETSERPAG
jgi:hypothetical protein